jgi:DNA-binding transcriptional LysR family regulator
MGLRITLRQLEYFVAAGEEGSIICAAERINISPPSISMAVSSLEREFGVQLFVRHHAQGLSLTHAGRILLEQSKRLLAQTDQLCSAAFDLSERVGGRLAVGCLITLAPMILPELIHSFMRLHPTTEVQPFEGNQEQLLHALQRAELDLLITYDLQLQPQMRFRPLVSLPPHVLLGENHRLAGRPFLTLEDLENEDFLLLDLPISSNYFLSLFQAAQIEPRILYRSTSLEVVRTMVANDQGYSLANALPRSDLALDGRRIVRVPLAGDHQPMTIGLASLADVQKSKLFLAFESHCCAMIKEDHIPGMASLARDLGEPVALAPRRAKPPAGQLAKRRIQA